jgi:hypothetical protein
VCGAIVRAVEAASSRTLSGQKAQRIVDGMRSSVARRGVTGSTFDRVALRLALAGGQSLRMLLEPDRDHAPVIDVGVRAAPAIVA